MFGGHIAPINNKVDGSHGIGISDYPPQGTQNDPERRVWNTISMRYIEKLFQKSMWQRSYNLHNWRAFKIPRDGAISLYINSFTTMPKSEEERVAKEELAEAVALAHAQPAKKKRVKARGKMEEQRPKDEKVIEEAVLEQEQQPEGPEPQAPLVNDKRRASSPGALAAQRVILAPRTRRPSSGPTTLSEHPNVRPPSLTSKAPNTVPQSAQIYPAHKEPLTSDLPKQTTSIIKSLRTQPTGLMDAFRQRRRLGLAKKEAEARRKRSSAENKTLALQQSLIRETELKRQLAAAREELKGVRESAEAERLALGKKEEVEGRERRRRRNRGL